MKTQSISRRALAAGLALAPVVVLPAITLANAQAGGPIVAARAELEKLTRDEDRAVEKLNAATKIYEGLLPEQIYISIPGGHKYYNLADFDESCFGEVCHKVEWGRKLREELVEIDAAKKNAAKQSGISEAEEAVSDAYERRINLENKLLAMVPTSPADAAALLRLSRFVIEDDRDDGLDLSLAAIERVAEYFEGRGAA